jgi:hypothetical protein
MTEQMEFEFTERLEELSSRRQAKTITDEEKKELTGLIKNKRKIENAKNKPPKETKEERKERKERKKVYEQVVAEFYNLKAKKKELKEQLADTRAQIATIREDFPTVIGVLEGNIQGKADTKQRRKQFDEVEKRISELESKEGKTTAEKNELKNKKKRKATLDKEEKNFREFSAALLLEQQEKKKRRKE